MMEILAKRLCDLAQDRHIDSTVCFENWLDFMISCFDASWIKNANLREQLARKHEEDPAFFELMLGFYVEVGKAMDKGTWVDNLGEIYQGLFLTAHKAGKMGQFFTPKSVADLMAKCTLRADEPHFYTVNEPTCGSGRNVLAFEMERNRENRCFYVCEDMDPLCCKMCVCNLMAHGMHAVVICRDTLAYDWRDAWYVNECQYPIRASEAMNSVRHLACREECDSIVSYFTNLK